MPRQFASEAKTDGATNNLQAHFTMLKGILEGLVQSSIKSEIDMSKKSGDTYNIDKIEIKIDVHITTPVIETEPLVTEYTESVESQEEQNQ